MVHTLVAVPFHRDRVAALAGHRDFGVFQIGAATGFKVTAGAGEFIPCQVVQLNLSAAAAGHAGAGFPQEPAKHIPAFRAAQAQNTVGRAFGDFFPLDTLRLCPRRGACLCLFRDAAAQRAGGSIGADLLQCPAQVRLDAVDLCRIRGGLEFFMAQAIPAFGLAS